MITYGQTIEWTEADGTKASYSVNHCTSSDEAREAALRGAKAMGWTPPKWWQFWRWNDTRLTIG